LRLNGFEAERARAKGAKSAHGCARQPAEPGWRTEAGCRSPQAKSVQPATSIHGNRDLPLLATMFSRELLPQTLNIKSRYFLSMSLTRPRIGMVAARP